MYYQNVIFTDSNWLFKYHLSSGFSISFSITFLTQLCSLTINCLIKWKSFWKVLFVY